MIRAVFFWTCAAGALVLSFISAIQGRQFTGLLEFMGAYMLLVIGWTYYQKRR